MTVNIEPTFLIIGASKSGTSTLTALLQQHPQVFLSAVKEPHYFCLKGSGLPRNGPGDVRRLARVTDSWETYRGLFREAEGFKAVGEASTNYLYDPRAAKCIHDTLPDVRLVCLLRQPAERAYSAYKHLCRDGDETEDSFRSGLKLEAERKRLGYDYLWQYEGCGYYGRHVKAYYDLFPKERIRVYRFEDLVENPASLLEDLQAFLGIEPYGKFYTGIHENAAGGMRGQTITERFSGGFAGQFWRAVVPLQWRLRVRGMRRRRVAAFPPLDSGLASELTGKYAGDLHLLEELTGLDTASWRQPHPQAGVARR